jgi:hypothetical protein
MAGLGPATHVLIAAGTCKNDVDARDKRGHDGKGAARNGRVNSRAVSDHTKS